MYEYNPRTLGAIDAHLQRNVADLHMLRM